MKGKASIGATVLVALVAMMPGTSPARMRSVELSKNVCQTTGGGRFVDIPGFPGEKIDRRLLRDIKLLRRKYKIFITDGYSTDPAHSANGEHPIGLALDIVPNFAAGGTWNDIDRLARMAEPQQNQPRSPFRWVGYDGDAGHGRGHHLHLSYSHSATPPRTPAETVYSLRCPDGGGGGEQSGGSDGGGGGGGGGGGISTGGRATSDGGSGISIRSVAPTDLAPVHTETGGASR